MNASELNKITHEHKRTLFFILTAIVSYVSLQIFHEKLEGHYNPINHLSFHVMLEFFSIIVSFVIAIQARLIYPHTLSSRSLLIGGVFLSVGFLDLFHALTFNGMPHFFGESSVQRATWFWIVARITQTLGLLGVFLLKENHTISSWRYIVYPISFIYMLIWSILIFRFEDNLYLLAVDGQGTTLLKNGLEYSMCLMIGITVVLILREYKQTSDTYLLEIVISFVFIFFGELIFTRYVSVNDWSNLVGHTYKIIGFYFLMKATYINMIQEPYIRKYKTERSLKSIVNTIPCGITIVDRSGSITYANRVASQVLGIDPDQLLSKNIADQDWNIRTSNGQTFDHASLGVLKVLDTGTSLYDIQCVVKRQDQNDLYLSINSAPLLSMDGQVTGVVNAITDITEKRRDQQKIYSMAYYDSLTGLPNRRHFIEKCQEVINVQQRAAVVFIDIDRFKNINDTLGHESGDQFIKNVAVELESLAGDKVNVARMGGDEFTVLVSNMDDLQEVNQLVYGLLQKIQEPYILKGQDFRITASAGISIFPEDGDNAELLIRKAHIAMDRSKQNQRGYSYYSADMDANTYEALMIEQELRKAVNNEELALYYQPQISLKTGKLVGLEALVRWNHPEKGVVSPGVFIPIAEQTGLIIEIGNWVLKESCIQLRKWHDQGLKELQVSVNLSLRQFFEPNLSKYVKDALDAVHLDPKYLKLEITESMVMDADYTIKTLKELKEIGVEIAIDDFGTGYSSLSYLRKFPIDQLKIDKSFIRELDGQNETIVVTIIAMAKHLRLNVIAEGVETKEQCEFLEKYDCDEIQGYLISKPMPPTELGYLFLGEAEVISIT